MDFTDLSLDDVMDPGSKGREIRAAVADGVARGLVDAALCMQLAELCDAGNRPGVALELLTAALSGDLPDWAPAYALAAKAGVEVVRALPPSGNSTEERRILGGFFAGLDRLEDLPHTGAMGSVVAELARDPGASRAFVARFEDDPAMGGSQSAVGALLAAAQFGYDIERTRRLAGRLEGFVEPLLWSSRALRKFALLEGDYQRAETLCRETIDRHGGRLFDLCDLAVALFCQGREGEGRKVLAKTADLMRDLENVVERQRQIAEWSRQLDEAMAVGTVDGESFDRIGSAIHYTRSDLVRGFYDAHREECVEANGYRTVSGYTNNVMFGEVEKALAAHPSIRKVINYGTLCGIREYEISARYPGVVWAGYDISDLATEWNRQAYRRDNLVFDSDLERLLADLEARPGETLLVHCRTTDIMLPEAVKRVYRAARAHGVTRIMTAEYFTRSMRSLEYPDFEANPVDTVHWDGILMVHNYRKIMPETGYRVERSEFRPLPLLVSATGEGMLFDQLIELVHAVKDDR